MDAEGHRDGKVTCPGEKIFVSLHVVVGVCEAGMGGCSGPLLDTRAALRGWKGKVLARSRIGVSSNGRDLRVIE